MKKELVEDRNTVVSIAGESAPNSGTPGAYTQLMRTNSVDINDTKNIATVTDMSTVAGALADQIAQERTAGINVPMNLVISSPGYKKAHELYTSGAYAFMKVEMSDTLADQTKYTFEVGGEISGMPKAGGRPNATGNVNFAASEILTDEII